MTIAGIGLDLCDVSRMQAALERGGERLLARTCTDAERQAVDASAQPARELARRFAAKEACFKSLGGGWPDDMAFSEVELSADDRLELTGRAGKRAAERSVSRFWVAVAEDDAWVVAVVVAESA